MSELLDTLRSEFQDEEYRHAYANECLNTMIATQIKVLREQRGMTQEQLAVASGMRQPRIPLLEDASYENWTVNTLKRLAKAFDVALSVKFETFSRMVRDFESLSRESLQRATFTDDEQFQRPRSVVREVHPRRRNRRRRNSRSWSYAISLGTQPQLGNAGFAPKLPKCEEGAGRASEFQAAGQFAPSVALAATAGGNR